MDSGTDPFDRRRNRGFTAPTDDLDLEQRAAQRRAAPRMALRLWTEGRLGQHLDFHNCSNLSETGMFIENPDPYALGAEVEIEFNLPGIDDPITLLCRVVSRIDEASAPENIMGNGFEFRGVNPADRALIRAFIDANG